MSAINKAFFHKHKIWIKMFDIKSIHTSDCLNYEIIFLYTILFDYTMLFLYFIFNALVKKYFCIMITISLLSSCILWYNLLYHINHYYIFFITYTGIFWTLAHFYLRWICDIPLEILVRLFLYSFIIYLELSKIKVWPSW